MNALPFKRSYWVVPGKLLAGCYPGGQTQESSHAKAKGLLAVGVTDIVNLMESTESNHDGQGFADYLPNLTELSPGPGRTIQFSRYPIVDGSIPSRELMIEILDRIDAAIAKGGVVYVHCLDGQGRTGMVICCWLVRHGLAAPKNAVAKLKTLIAHNPSEFEPTPENALQIAFIKRWKAGPRTVIQPKVTPITGKLFIWAETGTEGAYWALQDDRHPQSYEGLYTIDEGDHLTILGRNKQVLWSGIITKDTETGAVPRPGNPDYIQQVALGWWVHWIQKGFEPNSWADYFDRASEDAYRGILVKKWEALLLRLK